MDEKDRVYILQIDEELFQIPFWKGYNEPADFVNHSCEPNAGFKNSPISLVAMRNIKRGEEVFHISICLYLEFFSFNHSSITLFAVFHPLLLLPLPFNIIQLASHISL